MITAFRLREIAMRAKRVAEESGRGIHWHQFFRLMEAHYRRQRSRGIYG